MTTKPTAKRLTTAECWALLEGEHIGRLAVSRSDGSPDIFPVNYVVHEGAVYLRSAPDTKMVNLDARPAAAFEIDGHDEEGAWSVVAHGTAARTVDNVEIEQSGIARLVSPSPRYKPHVLKLAVRTVTGRRFTERTEEPHATAAPVVSFPSNRQRSQRPEPIASHRPRPEGMPH